MRSQRNNVVKDLKVNELITPELLEAIDKDRVAQARRVKEANLGASAVKIMEYLFRLIKCTNHYQKQEIMKKIHKYSGKWLATDAM